jgi:uncharacterized protein YjbI with pentapeptide repeats
MLGHPRLLAVLAKRRSRQRNELPWALRHSGALVGWGIVLTATIGLFGVIVAPKLGVFVQHGLKGADRLTAQRDIRDIWIKFAVAVAGGFAAVLTWGRLELAQREHENEVSGQLTERFTRAIEQLGNENLDVRLGGIYGLERIARESVVDHGPIVEVLTTYVQEHSPWPPSRPGQYRPEAPVHSVPALRTRAADVQAVLTVIGRRNLIHEQAQEKNNLDLSYVDMRRATLAGAHLEGADLGGAHLEGATLGKVQLEEAKLISAHLEEANLEGANLIGAHLEEANLEGANLEGAYLDRVHLEAATLDGATLDGANLEGAHLEGSYLERAHLIEAHLEWANLIGAHLEEANLEGANLEGALLIEAHLEGADLGGAQLIKAHLERAILREALFVKAILWGAHLEGANLKGAHLEGADFEGAHLGGANLIGAHLEGAILTRVTFDAKTRWPEGFSLSVHATEPP